MLVFADRKVIKELNQRIEADPKYPLPDGYYKVKEKEIKYEYKLNDYQGIPESVIMATEILDELINAKFGIHIMEGIMTFEESVKVKP